METERKIDFVLCGEPHGPDSLDTQARIASDIGGHAAHEALATLARVLNAAPGDCHTAAAAVAHAELLWRIGMITEQMDKALPGFAEGVEGLKGDIERHSGAKFRRDVGAFREALFGKAP